jgi:hypothetical protein
MEWHDPCFEFTGRQGGGERERERAFVLLICCLISIYYYIKIIIFFILNSNTMMLEGCLFGLHLFPTSFFIICYVVN